jgi:hypothetical protein
VPNYKYRQPRWRVISAKMPIRFAAHGAFGYDFEIVMQYAALTATWASS